MFTILGGDGKQYGPVTAETLHEWIAQGRVNADTKILVEGSSTWQAAGTVPELAEWLGITAGGAFGGMGAGGNQSARDAALAHAVPAGWALMVIGRLGVLMCIGMIALYAIRGVPKNPFLEKMMSSQGSSEAMRVGQTVGVFGSLVLGIAWAGFIAFAGGKLRRLESWGLVLTGAILAVLPCCGSQFPLCVLSAPVGIWAMVVLSKHKQLFT